MKQALSDGDGRNDRGFGLVRVASVAVHIKIVAKTIVGSATYCIRGMW
jgi:hypothetical protein